MDISPPSLKRACQLEGGLIRKDACGTGVLQGSESTGVLDRFLGIHVRYRSIGLPNHTTSCSSYCLHTCTTCCGAGVDFNGVTSEHLFIFGGTRYVHLPPLQTQTRIAARKQKQHFPHRNIWSLDSNLHARLRCAAICPQQQRPRLM